MVLTNKYTKDLAMELNYKEKDKAFSKVLGADLSEISTYQFFDKLSDYLVFELIKNNEEASSSEINIYEKVEGILKQCIDFPPDTEENDACNAICTGFLENLLNYVSYDEIPYDRFVPYLGETSREYCKYWDQFTGVRSPGLWSDEEWEKSPKGKDSVG